MAKKKHPKDMTNEETIRHLFHPKVVKHVKAVIAKHDAKAVKKEATN